MWSEQQCSPLYPDSAPSDLLKAFCRSETMESVMLSCPSGWRLTPVYVRSLQLVRFIGYGPSLPCGGWPQTVENGALRLIVLLGNALVRKIIHTPFDILSQINVDIVFNMKDYIIENVFWTPNVLISCIFKQLLTAVDFGPLQL